MHGRKTSLWCPVEPETTTSAANECSNKTSDSEKDKNSTSLFPPDLFTPDQLKHGGVILYIIGIIYMFYALALVCDEFFVPSLDVITEKVHYRLRLLLTYRAYAQAMKPVIWSDNRGAFLRRSTRNYWLTSVFYRWDWIKSNFRIGNEFGRTQHVIPTILFFVLLLLC